MEQKYKKLDMKLADLAKSKTKNTTEDYVKFYRKVANNTDTKFSDEELALLNKGLKYNLIYKQKSWSTTLALEAETAINQLSILEQDYMRHQVAINLQKLYTHHNRQHRCNTKQDIQEKKP
jgi:hypothetical protein